MSESKVEKAMFNISDFYFGDSEDGGEAMFKGFALKHGTKFRPDLEIEEHEHKLEFTDVYKEFQILFEAKIEELIDNCGLTQEEFVDAIKEKSKTDLEVKMFLDILGMRS